MSPPNKTEEGDERDLRVDEGGFWHESSVGPRRLMWCRTHADCAWVYDDGGVYCWWECVVETSTDDHELVDLPQLRGRIISEAEALKDDDFSEKACPHTDSEIDPCMRCESLEAMDPNR